MRPAGRRSFRGDRHAGARLPALERYGVRVMSLALLAGEDQALLADNASMVGLLVRGLLELVDWGDPDVLVLDLPPGTGEPLATILQTVQLDAVVLVTTPQDVARLDAGRALAVFQSAKVPVLGVVENMAYLLCPHCGERIEVFHRGRVPRAVAGDAMPLLAEIPLDLGFPLRPIAAGRCSSWTWTAPRPRPSSISPPRWHRDFRWIRAPAA